MKSACTVIYSTSVACWLNSNAPSDTGYILEKRTSTIGLFLFERTVSVASENIAASDIDFPTLPTSWTGVLLALPVFDVLERKSENCFLSLGKPIPVSHSCNSR